MKKPNWLIIEKPQFNLFPKLKFGTSKYCYLLPTGNGCSKSVSELKYNSDYSGLGNTVYSSKAIMLTYAYTIFFLWFRLHIEVNQRKMSTSYLQSFKPLSKGEKTIQDVLG